MSGQTHQLESVTGAGPLRGCKNTEFVWELRKMGFNEDGRK